MKQRRKEDELLHGKSHEHMERMQFGVASADAERMRRFLYKPPRLVRR